MERAVGEIFDFNGVKLQVKDTVKRAVCIDGCYFAESEHNCLDPHNTDCIGYCNGMFRSDRKNVVFVEVNNDKKE